MVFASQDKSGHKLSPTGPKSTLQITSISWIEGPADARAC